jgi:hypothetical protein
LSKYKLISIAQLLYQIDKRKPVYVDCKTVKHFYDVTLILQSNVFVVYNNTLSHEDRMQYINLTRENILI